VSRGGHAGKPAPSKTITREAHLANPRGSDLGLV